MVTIQQILIEKGAKVGVVMMPQDDGWMVWMGPETLMHVKGTLWIRNIVETLWAAHAAIVMELKDRDGKVRKAVDEWLAWEASEGLTRMAVYHMMKDGVEAVGATTWMDKMGTLLDEAPLTEWGESPGDFADLMANAAVDFAAWFHGGGPGGGHAANALRQILDEPQERPRRGRVRSREEDSDG